MIPFNIKIAFRNLIRNKTHSVINIAGLAMGIMAFIFILQYVSLERGVNKFHTQLPVMYRLLNEDNKGGTWPEIEPGYAKRAKDGISDIKSFCRFETGIAQGVVQNPDKNISFREQRIGYAEGNFFQFFSFPIIDGDPASLVRPDVMFISQSSATKYFGTENPLGKSLILANQFGNRSFSVGGVFKDMGDNSDIRYDMVFSLEALNNPEIANNMGWAALNNLESQYINTFFTLEPGADHKSVENKLNVIRKELDKDNDGLIFRLQPAADIHLGKSTSDTYAHFGQIKYVWLMGAIALLIILIAWFNYINFSTANALNRSGEVGIRKVIGATRYNLVSQFLSESLLVNVFGFIFAAILVSLFQPYFNNMVGKNLSWQSMTESPSWLYGLGLLILGSLISGAYTAFVLSNFNPAQTIKGKLLKSNKGVLLRKVLVVSQFSISIALIIGTLAIYFQLKHMRNKDLGFAPEQLIVIRGPQVNTSDSSFKYRQEGFNTEIGRQSFVLNYCHTGTIPGQGFNFATSGFTQPASKSGDELNIFPFAIINDQYLPTYQIPLVAGRNFTAQEADVEWNKNSKIIINETAYKKLGFNQAEEALHTRIKWDERYLDIIGVIKDYNHSGVKQNIDPIIYYPLNSSSYWSVRVTPENLQAKMSNLESNFKTFFPGNPFEYFFVDENFNKAYLMEAQYGKLFIVASTWAIIIACLGLFGLATFTIQSRTREIGIRKVLGAGWVSLLNLVSKDFIQLILIAILIASPIAYLGLRQWLADFAYRIKLEWWLFAGAGVFVLLMALFIIVLKAIKVMVMNPVRSMNN